MTRYTDAVAFAQEAHAGQVRKGPGEVPYFTHPSRVAERLWKLGIKDEDIRIAALLHDVVEDTEVTLNDIYNRFGTEVCDLVGEMTHFKKPDGPDQPFVEFMTKREYLNSFRLKSIGACLIKLADRADNLRDMTHDPKRLPSYAAEGLQIVAAVYQNSRWEKAPAEVIQVRNRLAEEIVTAFRVHNFFGENAQHP